MEANGRRYTIRCEPLPVPLLQATPQGRTSEEPSGSLKARLCGCFQRSGQHVASILCGRELIGSGGSDATLCHRRRGCITAHAERILRWFTSAAVESLKHTNQYSLQAKVPAGSRSFLVPFTGRRRNRGVSAIDRKLIGRSLESWSAKFHGIPSKITSTK